MKAILCGLLLLSAPCFSEEPTQAPAWIHEQSRTMINGDILHWGTGTGPAPEDARFKAEAMAVINMANECSLAHRDIKIWDRYVEKQGEEYVAYARSGLSFEACEQGKLASPAEKTKLESPRLAEILKQYRVEDKELVEKSTFEKFKDWIASEFEAVKARLTKDESKVAALEKKMQALKAAQKKAEQAKQQAAAAQPSQPQAGQTDRAPASIPAPAAQAAALPDYVERVRQFIVRNRACVFAAGLFHGVQDYRKYGGSIHQPGLNDSLLCAFDSVHNEGTLEEWRGCEVAWYDPNTNQYEPLIVQRVSFGVNKPCTQATLKELFFSDARKADNAYLKGYLEMLSCDKQCLKRNGWRLLPSYLEGTKKIEKAKHNDHENLHLYIIVDAFNIAAQ